MYLGDFIKTCEENTTLDIVRNIGSKTYETIIESTPKQIEGLLRLFGAERAIDYGTVSIESIEALHDGGIRIFIEWGEDEE